MNIHLLDFAFWILLNGIMLSWDNQIDGTSGDDFIDTLYSPHKIFFFLLINYLYIFFFVWPVDANWIDVFEKIFSSPPKINITL